MCNNVTEDAGIVVNIPVLHAGDIQLDLWLMTEDSHDLNKSHQDVLWY